MQVKIKMKPANVVKANIGIDPNGRAQKFFTNTCFKNMTKYVPLREGTLRTTYDLQDDSIKWEAKYAKYQYRGMREDGSHVVKKYTTPGTGPYWDKRMVSADLPRIIEETKKYIGR